MRKIAATLVITLSFLLFDTLFIVEGSTYETTDVNINDLEVSSLSSKALNGGELIESISINRKQLLNNEEQDWIVKLKDLQNGVKATKAIITYERNNNSTTEVDLYDHDYDGIFDGFYPLYDFNGIEDWIPKKLAIEYNDGTSNIVYDISLPKEENQYYYDLSPLQFNVMSYSTISEIAKSVKLDANADKQEEMDFGSNRIKKVFTNANISYGVTTSNFELIDSAKIYIKNQENEKYNYSIDLTKNKNKLNGSYNIKSNMANGHYDVEKLEIILTNGYKMLIDRNYDTDFFNLLENADIYIANYDIDISSLRINPASVTPDSWIEIKVNSLDYPEKSNDTVSIGYMLQYDGYGEGKDVELKLNGNVYEGAMYVDKNIKLGTYSPTSIYSWMGSPEYTYEIVADEIDKNGQFTVTNAFDDIVLPQLESIKINSSSIYQGEELTIEATATDNKSGVDRIEVDYGSFIVVLKAEGNKFVGGHYLSYYTIPGDYTTKSIRVYDKAGNISSNYSDKLKSLNFTLKPSNINGGVVLDTINISKNKLSTGEKIEFVASFIGIPVREEVIVTIEHSEFGTEINIPLKQSGNKFVGSIPVNEDIANGKWYFKSIHYYTPDSDFSEVIMDMRYVDLTIGLFGDFSNCYFDVYDNKVDAYYIDSSTFIKTVIENKVINGDVYINSFNDDKITFKGNVTINGNLYVVGNLFNKAHLNVTGSIYASEIVKREPGVNEKGLIIDEGGKINQGDLILGENIVPYKIKFYDIKNNILFKGDNSENYLHVEGKVTPKFDVSITQGRSETDVFGNFYIEPYINDVSDEPENIEVCITDRRGNSEIIMFRVVHEKFDVNKDNDLDILDLAMLAGKYNTSRNESGYDIKLDYNRDGIIDIFDLIQVARNM